MFNQPLQYRQKTKPEPLIISELKAGSTVYGWLLIVGWQTRIAINGKPYLYLKLGDPRETKL